jgi:hypothetical protein
MKYRYVITPEPGQEARFPLQGTLERHSYQAAQTKLATIITELHQISGIRYQLATLEEEDLPLQLRDWVGRKYKFMRGEMPEMEILMVDTMSDEMSLKDADGNIRRVQLSLHIDLWRLGKAQIV